MTKILFYMLGILFFVMPLASATDISINPVSVPYGESVTVEVIITPTEKVSGYQFNLQYNTSIFSSSIVEGTLFTKDGYSTYFYNGSVSSTGQDNILSVILGPYSVTTSGVASKVYLTLDYSKVSIGQELYINFTDVLIASDIATPVPYNAYNGRVVVVPNFDLNQDGLINVLDLVAIVHHLREPVIPSTQRYDLNQDKQINVLDLLQIVSHMK